MVGWVGELIMMLIIMPNGTELGKNFPCYYFSQFKAHVVSAFEQSLANMTSRLSQLTITAEEKVMTHIMYLLFKL